MLDNPLLQFGFPGVIAAFSRRDQGNMSLNCGLTQDSLENRRRFLAALSIDNKNLVCAQQVHGKQVVKVTQSDLGCGALDFQSAIKDTDGFITAEKNLPIAVFTADCLSVFIYDPGRPAIALLHAGWRSTELNIAQVGVGQLQKNFGSKPQELYVGFGPCIGACCFEVEENFKTNFEFGLIKRNGRTYFDIALVNFKQLLNCGLKEEHIFNSGLCTFSLNQEFFSFRKEAAQAGRLISVVMLK